MNTLFIGGPADGKWIDVKDGTGLFLIGGKNCIEQSTLVNESMRTYEYEKAVLRGKDVEYNVMVFARENQDIIKMLINGYRKQERRDLVELEKAEKRLVNAFRLVKNGKRMRGYKFHEFKLLMDKPYDQEGNLINNEYE